MNASQLIPLGVYLSTFPPLFHSVKDQSLSREERQQREEAERAQMEAEMKAAEVQLARHKEELDRSMSSTRLYVTRPHPQ